MRFYVEYCFRNTDVTTSDGKWHTDILDNNGKYFTEEEAERVAKEIMEGSVCDVKWAEVVPYDDRGDYSPYAVDHDEDEDMRMGIDYSPSCPWNAPGMSISDFI